MMDNLVWGIVAVLVAVIVAVFAFAGRIFAGSSLSSTDQARAPNPAKLEEGRPPRRGRILKGRGPTIPGRVRFESEPQVHYIPGRSDPNFVRP
jgi:hypothetical protein